MKTMARLRAVIHRASDHTLELPNLHLEFGGDEILDELEGTTLLLSHGDGVQDIIDLRHSDFLDPVSTIRRSADRTHAQNEDPEQNLRRRSFHVNLRAPWLMGATREQ
jgi:hypothetical protein